MGLFRKNKMKNASGFLELEIKPLIDWNEPNGEGAIASDRITRDGWKVGYMYMYRDEPVPGCPDSGWHFFKGDEDEAYSHNPDHHHVFALNTIANHDPDIIPYLHAPVGSHLIRTSKQTFIPDDGRKAIHMEKQKH